MIAECRWASDQLQLFVDGRLDVRQLSRLEAHLDGCSACRAALAAFELVAEASAERMEVSVPEDLTHLIMARIAAYEVTRRAEAAVRFVPSARDGLLAALLATVSTVLFVLLIPALRDSAARAFPLLPALLSARGPDSIAWSVWAVWIASGAGLALWLAGAEVRASLRRRLSERLAQLPTLRQV
ncbi:MAG: anti-sigma factor family protein [Ktedonobacterales bacterium]